MVIAPVCLLATAGLAFTVAHGRSPYAFEDSVLSWLGPPSTVSSWAEFAKFLSAPFVGVILVVAFVFALVRRVVLRLVAYVALAAAALLISELVAKPLVHRTYQSELTFPSGSVTAVSAVTLALWLAFYPVLGRRARNIVFVLGAASTLLVSVAVVAGHWHTPVDVVGSIGLSVGVVSGGAVLLEPVGTPRSLGQVRLHRGNGPKEE